MIRSLRRAFARTPQRTLVTAGVATGLFFATRLGNFIPDAIAASVCMFAAGYLVGMITGLTSRPKEKQR